MAFLALFWALTARAEPPPPAPASAVPSAESPAPGPVCPLDFDKRRAGGCWLEANLFDGKIRWAYLHVAGWIVDERCFTDKRFPKDAFLAALDTAWQKLDPQTPVEEGGCLGTFNPEWGKELLDGLWREPTAISCPRAFDPGERTCAEHAEYEGDAKTFHVITLRNVSACMDEQEGGSGLAGVVLHETLHAADADSVSAEEHNLGWNRTQLDFVRDRVYGTEAVCFFGAEPKMRPLVNFEQCYNTVEYHASKPKLELCRTFDKSFTNLEPPPGFIKH